MRGEEEFFWGTALSMRYIMDYERGGKQYPSPWILDWKNYTLRSLFYWISKIERALRLGNIGYFAPNIVVIAEKDI